MLTLISVTASSFSIVNENGGDGQGRGLLLFNGQTVCDDSFSDNSATAICGLLRFNGFDSWTNGQLFDLQNSLTIGLDNVACSSASWDSCSYTYQHNCGHSEDVHLNCRPEGNEFEGLMDNKDYHDYNKLLEAAPERTIQAK